MELLDNLLKFICNHTRVTVNVAFDLKWREFNMSYGSAEIRRYTPSMRIGHVKRRQLYIIASVSLADF